MAKKVMIYNLSEPLPGGSEARIEIDAVDGNLQIDALPGGAELASGTLEYLENQQPPSRSMKSTGRKATLTVKSGSKGQPWLRMPWSACNGATEWHIHLTTGCALDIKAHSGGGNVTLDLSGLTITALTADTGGGNMDVILPDCAAGLHAELKSGAGNVTLHVPGSIPARIHATTGLGKVIFDGSFSQVDKSTYQTPGYESAVGKLEITASSGAGNVIIKETALIAVRH